MWNLKLKLDFHCPGGAKPLQRRYRKFARHPRDLGIFQKYEIPRFKPKGVPGAHVRAIILEQKLMTYVDFVMKYNLSPPNIGENKVGVETKFFICPAL